MKITNEKNILFIVLLICIMITYTSGLSLPPPSPPAKWHDSNFTHCAPKPKTETPNMMSQKVKPPCVTPCGPMKNPQLLPQWTPSTWVTTVRGLAVHTCTSHYSFFLQFCSVVNDLFACCCLQQSNESLCHSLLLWGQWRCHMLIEQLLVARLLQQLILIICVISRSLPISISQIV